MAYATLPESEAVLIVRALGLLVSQAGVYGAQHNVTQSAARSVFVEIEQALKTFGPVEFAISENNLLINGAEIGAGAPAGKNLFDRMTLYKAGGLLLSPPLDLREFLYFVGLFGTPPQTLAAQGGFEAVLKKAGFKSVQGINVSYHRVTGEAPESARDPTKARFLSAEAAVPRAINEAQVAPRPAPPLQSGVLDLSDAMAGIAPLNSSAAAGETSLQSQGVRPSALAYRQRTQALVAMLRDAAAALEQEAAEESGAVNKVLDRIREVLSEMTVGSRRGIATLASELEEDRNTIASIESAARRRGIGLKLTRSELLQRYAELNQEIVQPLTVSSGVIEMLHSGKTGEMSEAQVELLKMASESMDRVNQLVNYLNSVTGLPADFTPDARLISETYQ